MCGKTSCFQWRSQKTKCIKRREAPRIMSKDRKAFRFSSSYKSAIIRTNASLNRFPVHPVDLLIFNKKSHAIGLGHRRLSSTTHTRCPRRISVKLTWRVHGEAPRETAMCVCSGYRALSSPGRLIRYWTN